MKADESPIDDKTSYLNDGVLKGAGEPNYLTDAPTGYNAGSYDFDATDDYVNCGSDAELDNIGAMTIVA